MRIRVEPSTWVWEPVTPRGVAVFARAPASRVLVVQWIVASLAAVTVVWFLNAVWFPTVLTAIRQLPAQGELRRGRLTWPGESPSLLAQSRCLSLVVDLDHQADLGHEADLCLEFGQQELRVISLVGYLDLKYPPEWTVAVNRLDLEAWWGAWKPVILAGAALAVVLALSLIWFVLASVYSLPVWLVAFFANRQLSWLRAWRLAAAALMPGALVMIAAIFLYGLGWLGLVRLGLCAALHLVIGWIYVFVSPIFLPREPIVRSVRGNPFAQAMAPGKKGESQRP